MFHKWEDIQSIKSMNMPKVFWYFDLIDYPDKYIRPRCLRRIRWINEVTPIVDLGFCTDGDWVRKDKSGKLFWLPQGADSRITGRGTTVAEKPPPILFTGTANGGEGRSSWVKEMNDNYRRRFNHVSRHVYREELRGLIANTKIVTAPDHPITDQYWSNRVYNVLGFGGFIIHPYCAELAKQYVDGKEIVFYKDRQEMRDQIAYYINKPQARGEIRKAGLKRTLADHTYLHRCRKLIKIVEERVL